MPLAPRLAVLRERDFRRFFIGYGTSLLGSSMASVAVTFAILQSGGGGSQVGYVMAARVLPIVLVLLAGGVVSDRLGSRQVMLAADAVRCLTQAALAGVLLDGRPPPWALIVLVAVWGAAEALFTPALGALVPAIARGAVLSDANALLDMARSGAPIAGPALAGVLIATAGPSCVLALDAASYAASLIALLLLPRAATPPAAAGPASFMAELREGWSEFRSRTWVWVTSLQFCLFNFLVWAPFLVLGPLVAQRRLGGATSWGLVMTLYGAGAVAGGLAMLGRSPRRPLVAATAATFGYALPSAALATARPLPWICAAAFLAGAGSAVSGTLYATTTQRHVPRQALARVNAYTTFGAFVLGPLGLAAAGPLAAALGTSAVLGFGALFQLTATAAVLTLPAVRTTPRTPAPTPAPAHASHPDADTTSAA